MGLRCPEQRRRRQVVLRVAVQPLGPGVAGDGADLAGGDLDRERVAGPAMEVEPQRLGLMHRQQHAAAPLPSDRDPSRVVVHVAQRRPGGSG